MRGSLSGVRSRVDRLALKLVTPQSAGCASCRGLEREPKVVVFYGAEAPEPPDVTHCEACGRPIPYRYFFIRYDENMKPPDL